MKIVFMGSPDFAVPTLEKLLESSHEIVGVYSQPPRPSGRGKKVTKTAVHQWADTYKIPVWTPEKLLSDDCETLQNLAPDLIVVVAYGLLLPEAVLAIAPCLNLHPSALPKWRGAAPMNYPLLNGEDSTDICIMAMEKSLDTGAVYFRKSYGIGDNETAGELHDRFKTEGAKHMLSVVDNWEDLKDKAIPQKGKSSYAPKFKSEDLKQIRALDLSKTAQELHNQIRALSPWPSATFKHKDTEIKVLNSQLSSMDCHADRGTVCAIDEQGIHVKTGQGCLCFSVLQRPCKCAISSGDFLKGYEMLVGEKLR